MYSTRMENVKLAVSLLDTGREGETKEFVTNELRFWAEQMLVAARELEDR